MQIKFEEMVAHLRKIQTEHGNESFHTALKSLFRSLMYRTEGVDYIRRLLQEFGIPATTFDVMKAEVEASAKSAPKTTSAPVAAVLEAVKKEMPECKTQAHFDIVMQSWEALRVYLNAAFGRDMHTAAKAREGLNLLLDLAPQVGALQEKLEEAPEATTNADYVEEPKEFTEQHKQQTLLAELSEIGSTPQLEAWYLSSKTLMDEIVTQSLRNELYDAVREKKHSLMN